MEILAATPRRIARLIKGVPKRKLSRRPAPDTWAVAEILAHLADAELVVGYRIRLILGASGTDIQAYDQDAWAGVSDYVKHDPAVSLEGFRATRERTLRLAEEPAPQELGFLGMHSERGKETVTRMVEMLAGHDLNHLKQIEERVPKR